MDETPQLDDFKRNFHHFNFYPFQVLITATQCFKAWLITLCYV